MREGKMGKSVRGKRRKERREGGRKLTLTVMVGTSVGSSVGAEELAAPPPSWVTLSPSVGREGRRELLVS